MRRFLSVVQISFMVIGLGWSVMSPASANTAREFLDEIFRQEDEKRRLDTEKRKRLIVRPPVVVPRPVKPKVIIPDTTYVAAELPKDPAAKVILVVGDETATGLAAGLRQAYAREPLIDVKVATRDGIGIISGSSAEWSGLIKETITNQQFAAVVVMFGLSDRQALIAEDKIVEFREPRWRDIYQTRVESFLAAFGPLRARLYWTGLPAMRAAKDLADASLLSDIYKERVFAASARFVDVWEGFVDEDGKYEAVGPDVNGNKRRLRKADGIGLTPAGNRKLAFFVEEQLKRGNLLQESPLLSGLDAPPRQEANLPAAISTPAPAPGSVLLAPNFVGPVVQLTPISAKSGVELATGAPPRNDLAEQVLQKGDEAPTRAGRADDWHWPADGSLAGSPLGAQEQARAASARPAL